MKDTFVIFIAVLISAVVVGYLEQENIIPQENYFTSIIALIVVIPIIISLLNVIIRNWLYSLIIAIIVLIINILV